MSSMPLNETAQAIANSQNWQDKYRYLMKLGSQLNKNSQLERTDACRVHGCESQVWLKPVVAGEQVYFDACSDSRIVSGLIAVLLAALNQQSRTYILHFNAEQYFTQLGLAQQLSQSRTQGLVHIFKYIKQALKDSQN